MKNIKIRAELGRFSHDIIVTWGGLDKLGQQIKKLNIGDSPFIVTSPRIGGYYLDDLKKTLKRSGFKKPAVYLLPDGERNKNFNHYRKVLESMAGFDDGTSKKIFVINLGGGVVGDLGGFAAASYKRGTPYVQVPSTLLAFTDCGVGGKVGVDLKGYKNYAGAVWQPALVYGDLKLLETLSKRHFKSGLAEVIKYGMSMERELFDYLKGNREKVMALDTDALSHISEVSYRLKVGLVEADPYDKEGKRVILNFGHTVGHAVESASLYKYTHGESVAIGMLCANFIAVKYGMLSADKAGEAEDLVRSYGLPSKIKYGDEDRIMEIMKHDKKFVNSKNRFVLLNGIGKTKIVEGIPVKIIRSAVRHYMEQ
ncbi:MAG: 3-dehydroquinate synthase [Fibrobacterota bacterium]